MPLAASRGPRMLHREADGVGSAQPSSALRSPEVDAAPRCLADDYWCDGMADLVESISVEGIEPDLNAVLGRIPAADRTDAVVDSAIRAIMQETARSARPFPDTTQQGIAQHLIERSPHLASKIRLAVLLDEALETDGVQPLRASAESRFERLPAEFGPVWANDEQRYLLVERLFGGRRSDTFRAIDRARSDGTRAHMVVVKMLPPEDQIGAQWAVSEASRLARVESSNVCRVVDAGTSEGIAYLVTDFIAGATLADFPTLAAFPLHADRAVGIILEVCRGLSLAHSVGVRHMDIHPGNVVMSGSGCAVLVDFGLGVCASASCGATTTGHSCGAPGFIAPEIVAQSRFGRVDFVGADVYSVGGLLLWLLTGNAPNGETVEEAESFFTRLQNDECALTSSPPGVERTGLDGDLGRILRRALAIDPQHRYTSVASLALDLDAWRRHEAIPWTSPTTLHRFRLGIQRTSPAKRWTIVTVASLFVGLVLLLIGQQISSLQRARDAAIARAAASDAAQAAAEASAKSGEIARQQVHQMANVVGVLNMMVDKPVLTRGPEWLPALVALRDVSAGLGNDWKLTQQLAYRRLDLFEHAERLLPDDPSDPSVEDAAFAAARGSWLLESNARDWPSRATESLERANIIVGALLPPNERFRRAVEYRYNVAKVIASEGRDSRAVEACRAPPEKSARLPSIIQSRLDAALHRASEQPVGSKSR